MARPPAERLRPSTYPWSFHIPPRFGDMDVIGHLNNAALVRFYEDARVRFMDAIGVRAALEPGCGFVVAEMTIQYLGEGRYPQVVAAASGLLRLGRSSVTIGQALFQDSCIGTADATLVYVHRKVGGARPLPDTARDAFHVYRLASGAPEAVLDPSVTSPSRESPHA